MAEPFSGKSLPNLHLQKAVGRLRMHHWCRVGPRACQASPGGRNYIFRKMQVYTRVPRAMQRMKGGKMIGGRWVDVSKGDSKKQNMRSHLVGQQFNTGKNDEL